MQCEYIASHRLENERDKKIGVNKFRVDALMRPSRLKVEKNNTAKCIFGKICDFLKIEDNVFCRLAVNYYILPINMYNCAVEIQTHQELLSCQPRVTVNKCLFTNNPGTYNR